MSGLSQHVAASAGPLAHRAAIHAWHQRLLLIVDLGLAGVIFVAPLFMGGRGPVGRLVLVGFICLMAVAWAARQCLEKRASWTWSGAEWLILLGLCLVVFQLLPLPAWLLATVSPTTFDLLPLWRADADPAVQLGLWNQISLDPVATRGGLVMYSAYALLFLVVVQRVRSLEDAERLLRWIALAAAGMATLGLMQFLLGNGKFLWVYEHPSRDTYHVVKGTFQNQNHFAHFLALGFGPLIGWLYHIRSKRGQGSFGAESAGGPLSRRGSFSGAVRRDASGPSKWVSDTTLRHMLCVGLGIVAVAGLLTFSRGGVIALFVAAAATVGIFIRASLLGKKSLLAIAGFALLVGVALGIHGYEPLAQRLSTLRDARSLEEVCRGRDALWRAHAAAIPKSPFFGSGVGSHREVYPVYLTEHFDVEFTHGENGYLHLLLETGLTGLACLLAGFGLALTWCLRSCGSRGDAPSRTRCVRCAGAIAAGILASLAHSCGDFVWYIPACMSLTLILLACASRLQHVSRAPLAGTERRASRSSAQPSRSRTGSGSVSGAGSWTLPRPAWAIIAVCVLGVSCGMLHDRLPPALAAADWDRYLKSSAKSNLLVLDDRALGESVAALLGHVERVVQKDADDPRANLRMAALLLRHFDMRQKRAENPLSLSQIRDAALASQFPTREAQDAWLDIAVGENRKLLDRALPHARRAVQRCPLQGEGYIYLAELSFLNGPQDAAKKALVAQAERVRPYSGVVQFAVGKEAALAGDLPKAMQQWKKAFHQDPEVRSLIVEALGPQLPAIFFLREFQPQRAGLAQLFGFYQRVNRLDEAQVVGRNYAAALTREAQTLQKPAAAADCWHTAHTVHDFLGDLPQAIDCERRAIDLTPDDFGKRRTLAGLLLRSERFDEALEHLQWCRDRAPDDGQLLSMLTQANRKRLESGASATIGTARRTTTQR